MPRPLILNVGQCALDHDSISRHLARSYGAEVLRVRTAAEAVAALRDGPCDLVLVNRVGDADGAPGVDLIRTLKADPDLQAVPVMLVSNYPDAQAEAVDLGALPGFGKAQLGGAEARERLAFLKVNA